MMTTAPVATSRPARGSLEAITAKMDRENRAALRRCVRELSDNWRRRCVEERVRTSVRKLTAVASLLSSASYDLEALPGNDVLEGMSEILYAIIDELTPIMHAPGSVQGWAPENSERPTPESGGAR